MMCIMSIVAMCIVAMRIVHRGCVLCIVAMRSARPRHLSPRAGCPSFRNLAAAVAAAWLAVGSRRRRGCDSPAGAVLAALPGQNRPPPDPTRLLLLTHGLSTRLQLLVCVCSRADSSVYTPESDCVIRSAPLLVVGVGAHVAAVCAAGEVGGPGRLELQWLAAGAGDFRCSVRGSEGGNTTHVMPMAAEGGWVHFALQLGAGRECSVGRGDEELLGREPTGGDAGCCEAAVVVTDLRLQRLAATAQSCRAPVSGEGDAWRGRWAQAGGRATVPVLVGEPPPLPVGARWSDLRVFSRCAPDAPFRSALSIYSAVNCDERKLFFYPAEC